VSSGDPIAVRAVKPIADRLVEVLAPACQNIAVVGSIRRERPFVRDVELLCVPLATAQSDMFGMPLGTLSQLDDAISGLIHRSAAWEWDRHQVRRGERWKRLHYVPKNFTVDIFVTTARAWAANLIVRTGPSGFSQHIMGTARRMGWHFADGFLLHAHEPPCMMGGECPQIIELPTEERLFEALRLPWKTPVEREAFKAVTPQQRAR